MALERGTAGVLVLRCKQLFIERNASSSFRIYRSATMNEYIAARTRKSGHAPESNRLPDEAFSLHQCPSANNDVLNELPAVSASGIKASIVVPTYGRPALIKQCLNSLLRQNFDHTAYEVIIVDDGPHEATRAAVMECISLHKSPAPRVIYVASPGPHGPAAARNHGWRSAAGQYIAFTDDDTIASPKWLQNGLDAFSSDVKAVWGKIHMPFDGIPTDYERDAKGLETAEFVTANCFCTKAALEEIGGFDEQFKFAWREDSDLYFRLLNLPGSIVHAPEALITHPIRPASWGVSIRQQKKVLFDALLYKKHPSLYRQRIRPKPRWDYYVITAALLMCLVFLPLKQVPLAIASGTIWLILTLRFCAMRLKDTAKTPSHIIEMLVTSAAIPPLAVFWRLTGAVKFRVALI
jgi:GT2 family glycosyltransferase